MKIGWVSVSPWARTGYGRATRDIVTRLSEEHEIICIGHEADVIIWGGKKEFTLPNGKKITTLAMKSPLIDPGAASGLVQAYASRYKMQLLIGFWDGWALSFMKNAGTPYAVYVPIDGPLTKKWADSFGDAYRVITYSQYGLDQALRFFPPSKVSYIPHGVDTKAFRPLEDDKAELRKKLDCASPVPEDAFLFTFTGANFGGRKHIPLMLRTFARFASAHKDAHLYLHTNAYSDAPHGYDLPTLCDTLGIRDRVHWPTFDPILEPAEDEELCRLYNASDAYITDSVGEGFGLPVLEAMSSGLPAIAPMNSSMPELVDGKGWMVRNVPEDVYVDYPVYVPTLQTFPVPDQLDLIAKMAQAYDQPDLRKYYSMRSRQFALQYDWDAVVPLWKKELARLEEEISMFAELREQLKPE
jgi:glycosyltransferase involved in cell wall biosynthesis